MNMLGLYVNWQLFWTVRAKCEVDLYILVEIINIGFI
jgi:hypothetical protein